jgi:hypothetical protein
MAVYGNTPLADSRGAGASRRVEEEKRQSSPGLHRFTLDREEASMKRLLAAATNLYNDDVRNLEAQRQPGAGSVH